MTPRIDLSTGAVTGTDITVSQLASGTIVLTKVGSAALGQTWSGVVDSIKFKSKITGQSTVTYSIQ